MPQESVSAAFNFYGRELAKKWRKIMNRLTKILSAIALASAVSTGMVVVAGCNGCNQPETPPLTATRRTCAYIFAGLVV